MNIDNGYTSYTVRGLHPVHRQPVGMATTKSRPDLALKIAEVFQADGLQLEIYWSHYQPQAFPGEQGTLTIAQLSDVVSDEKTNGSPK